MNDAAQRRLLDRLCPEASRTGQVRRLLATTHNLEAEFFDGDFLCTALSVAQADFVGHSGKLALQRKLAELDYSGVLCEARAYEHRPSLRTVVHPVTLRGACLHAKLVVIEYEHAVRILVGSANLTSAGYRHNREVCGEHLAYYDEPEQAARAAAILRSARSVLAPFAERAQEFLTELGTVLERLENWAGASASEASPVIWSDAEHPLWRAVLERWPARTAVERIRILSPFWCEDGSSDTPLRRLLKELQSRKALGARCTVELLVESAPLGDGSFVAKKPLCVYYADFPGVSVREIPVSPKVDPADLDTKLELTAVRALHAKVFVLEGRERALAYAGSANFTRNGFALKHVSGAAGVSANIEAGWVFELSPAAAIGLFPETANAGQKITSLERPLEGTALDEDGELDGFWPDALLSAELTPAAAADELDLTTRWAAETPSGWALHAPNGEDGKELGVPLLTTAGGTATLKTALSASVLGMIFRHRHVLVVAPHGQAAFPVNVAAGEARLRLPLSPVGTKPGESDLFLYYQGRLAFDDLYLNAEEAADGAPTADGAAREASAVDKSRIQAYQIRAFVDALPGMERELREARGSGGALYQAFLGEVSPVAIAREVIKQVSSGSRSATAAAFQLVELSALLRSVGAQAPEEVEHYTEMCSRARSDVDAKLELLRTQYPQELSAKSGFGLYTRRLAEMTR